MRAKTTEIFIQGEALQPIATRARAALPRPARRREALLGAAQGANDGSYRGAGRFARYEFERLISLEFTSESLGGRVAHPPEFILISPGEGRQIILYGKLCVRSAP